MADKVAPIAGYVGYMRVSKADGTQVLDLQRDALIKAGVHPDKIWKDMASGKDDARPGLENCLKALNAGDTLLVWRLDRLGRSVPHLLNTVKDLQARGVHFRALNGQAFQASPDGRLMLAIFAALAEFEADLIAERTKAGVAAARARGRVGGPKPKLSRSMLLRAQAAMRDNKTDVTKLAEELGVSRFTLYKFVAPGGELRARGRKVLGLPEEAEQGA